MDEIFKPLFSIITICYNEADTIEKTIVSVINQTYKNYEYIIIDGCSHDETMDIIMNFRKFISILISEPDNGIFDAMNKGLFNAHGKYIIYMNAGDTFYSNDVLERVYLSLKGNDYDFIYGDTVFKYPFNSIIKKANPFYIKKHIAPMGICHQSIFLKTTIARSIQFNTKFKLTADYNMIYNAFKEYEISVKYLCYPISIYNINGISSINYSKTIYEILVIYKNENPIYKLFFIFKYCVVMKLYKFIINIFS